MSRIVDEPYFTYSADIVDIALYCCKDYLALRNAFFTR